MDEILALLGDHHPCLLFQQLILERLPEDICIQLADAKFDDVRQLARRVDALWAARGMGRVQTLSNVENPPKKEQKPGAMPCQASFAIITSHLGTQPISVKSLVPGRERNMPGRL